MLLNIRRRSAWVVACAAAFAANASSAQEWVVYGGVASRIEYNDNYFFTDPSAPVAGDPAASAARESASTLSILPFVAAARRTEVSEVTALLSVGWNKVWGPAPSDDYLSGSFALNGTLTEERATWAGGVSYSRSPQLQNVVRGEDVVLALTYTDAARLSGSYTYLLSDRWTVGASVGGFANWYDSVRGADDPNAGLANDDSGFSVSANAAYVVSDQTQATGSLGYSYYSSDRTRSNAVTATIGVLYRFSPQLTVSASVGGFWTNTTARQALDGEEGTIVPGETRDANGQFYGGSLNYAISEATRIDASLSESLSPSGTGVLSKSDVASVGLTHQFGDRLTGRLSGSYGRTSYPVADEADFSDDTIQAQAGLTYQLAERWTIDAGYTYARTKYSRNDSKPYSNVAFISVAYNWPGPSYTNWVGRPRESPALPGAGPLATPPGATPAVGAPATAPGTSPFDTFTLP